MGVTIEARPPGHRPRAEPWPSGGFDAAFLAVGAQLGKRADIPAGDAARILDALSRCCTTWPSGEPPHARPPRRRLRRRQHRDGRRPHRPAARRHRRHRRLPAHPRPDARARRRSRRGHGEGVTDALAVHHQPTSAAGSSPSRRWAGRDRLPAADRRVRGRSTADAVVLALGQDGDLRCSTACPASRSTDGVVEVDADLMTGHPGIFAGGDMVAGRAHRDRRRSATARRPPAASTPGCGGRPRRPAAIARRWPTFDALEHLVLRRRAGHGPAAAGGGPPGRPPSTRWSAAWTSRTRCSRPAAACPAATASSATTATASARTTR